MPSSTVVGGRLAIRPCWINPRSRMADVEGLVADFEAHEVLTLLSPFLQSPDGKIYLDYNRMKCEVDHLVYKGYLLDHSPPPPFLTFDYVSNVIY